MTITRQALNALAREHGFHALRVANVGPTPFATAFDRWLEAGRHADMDWLPRTRDVRVDPRVRQAEVRSALVLAVNHAVTPPPDPGGLTGQVARYAWGRDYHNLVGKRLKRLLRTLRDAGIPCWGGVDTAPILERAWAHASGLGYTGKNCVQIVPAQGSWMVLAVVFADADWAPDPPLARDHCGACVRCLVSCPTDAFVGPRTLDARRCISYWTIEASDLAPVSLLPRFGRWVFGCDVCQEVCPHNASAADGVEADFAPQHAWLDLEALIHAQDDLLMDRFLGTPLRRPRARGLKRNALVVLGNLADAGAPQVARHGLRHSDDSVRAAARWALARHGVGLGPLPAGASPSEQRVQDAIDSGAVPPVVAG